MESSDFPHVVGIRYSDNEEAILNWLEFESERLIHWTETVAGPHGGEWIWNVNVTKQTYDFCFKHAGHAMVFKLAYGGAHV